MGKLKISDLTTDYYFIESKKPGCYPMISGSWASRKFARAMKTHAIMNQEDSDIVHTIFRNQNGIVTKVS